MVGKNLIFANFAKIIVLFGNNLHFLFYKIHSSNYGE
tara:strand:- start:1063 stop:1173 length:111 start_codon:yes stop_codon:yes gene_type:complete